MKFFWKRAQTKLDIDECQRVRWHVIHRELDIAVRDPRTERDVDAADCLPTTEHVLVYADELCVGTGRLMFPDPEIARQCGNQFGLELEGSFDVRNLWPIRDQLVEVSRVAVMKDWYGKGAAACLFEGIAAVSWLKGKRVLLGEVDTQANILAHAQVMLSKLEQLGAMHPSYRVHAGSPARAPQATRVPPVAKGFYSAAALAAAQRGDLADVPLPRALSVFIKRLGARCIASEPALHPAFDRFVLAMLAPIEALPAATINTFDRSIVASTLGAHHFDSRDQQDRRIAS
jgi:putative hemolysin